MARPRICILLNQSVQKDILSTASIDQLRSFADVSINPEDRDLSAEEAVEFVRGADGVMASWGVTRLSSAILEAAPDLKIWSHAGGSLKYKDRICDEAWDKDIIITSAAPAVADDVAEFTLAMIGVALRRVFPLSRQMAEGERRPPKRDVRTLFRQTVGVISAGHVGKCVMRLLRRYHCRILLYDPFVTEEEAREQFGAEKVDLVTMARESDVVTCHAPKLDATKHMWNASHFRLMKDKAIFVNCSRGANIDEAAMIAELQTGRIFACIDVTEPEPCALDSPLRTLPNVILTPHIAGPHTYRVGEMAAEELSRCFAGEEPLYRVTKDMLYRIA